MARNYSRVDRLERGDAQNAPAQTRSVCNAIDDEVGWVRETTVPEDGAVPVGQLIGAEGHRRE